MKLILEDGTEAAGQVFGTARPVAGEVVFNTGMAGYIETLSDPSYKGQILALTYPLVGNYGVPPPRPAASLERPYESDHIQVQGLVVQQYVDSDSHHSATRSLGDWLRSENIPAITGVDTRTMTRRLRENGTMQGWLVPSSMSLEEARSSAVAIDMQDEVFRAVAPAETVRYAGGELTVLVIDVGAKDTIVRSLLARATKALLRRSVPPGSQSGAPGHGIPFSTISCVS